jgi:hypothetical protein
VAIEPASENGTRASAGACDRQAVLWNLTTPSSGPHLERGNEPTAVRGRAKVWDRLVHNPNG